MAGDPDIRPDVDEDGVPVCTEECPQHDGKRCRALGHRPSYVCEPRVVEMAAVLRQPVDRRIKAAELLRRGCVRTTAGGKVSICDLCGGIGASYVNEPLIHTPECPTLIYDAMTGGRS